MDIENLTMRNLRSSHSPGDREHATINPRGSARRHWGRPLGFVRAACPTEPANARLRLQIVEGRLHCRLNAVRESSQSIRRNSRGNNVLKRSRNQWHQTCKGRNWFLSANRKAW